VFVDGVIVGNFIWDLIHYYDVLVANLEHVPNVVKPPALDIDARLDHLVVEGQQDEQLDKHIFDATQDLEDAVRDWVLLKLLQLHVLVDLHQLSVHQAPHCVQTESIVYLTVLAHFRPVWKHVKLGVYHQVRFWAAHSQLSILYKHDVWHEIFHFYYYFIFDAFSHFKFFLQFDEHFLLFWLQNVYFVTLNLKDTFHNDVFVVFGEFTNKLIFFFQILVLEWLA